MKRELYRYISRIIKVKGAELLKEPRRFYAFLMDYATEHIDDVRVMVKYCGEDFLTPFYRARQSSVEKIQAVSDKACANLKRDTDIEPDMAEYLSEQMGKGLAFALHPRKKWPRDLEKQRDEEERKAREQEERQRLLEEKRRREIDQRRAEEEERKRREKEEKQRKAEQQRIEEERRRKAAARQKSEDEQRRKLASRQRSDEESGRRAAGQQFSAGSNPNRGQQTGSQPSQQKASSANRWVPIWEQPDQGIKAVPRKTVRRTDQDEAEEELARVRQSQLARQRQAETRQKLHEETVRMFGKRHSEPVRTPYNTNGTSRNRNDPSSVRDDWSRNHSSVRRDYSNLNNNSAGRYSWNQNNRASGGYQNEAQQDEKFEFWNDNWNTLGRKDTAEEVRWEGYQNPAGGRNTGEKNTSRRNASGIYGNPDRTDERMQVLTAGGEVLRTVEKGARLPLHLTIYPRGITTFTEGVTIRVGHRRKYRIQARGPASEFSYLQFTYQADGSLTDVVLFGTMSRKKQEVDITRF